MPADALLIREARARLERKRERELAELARLMRQPSGLAEAPEPGAAAPREPRYRHGEDDQVVNACRSLDGGEDIVFERLSFLHLGTDHVSVSTAHGLCSSLSVSTRRQYRAASNSTAPP
jgi:hypothetical protein